MTLVKLRIVEVLLMSGVFLFATALGLGAQSEPFYSGKTVRIIVGFTPGGFYDRWARLRSIEEAKKSQMDMEHTPGEELQTLMKELMNQPRDVIERVKKVLTE